MENPRAPRCDLGWEHPALRFLAALWVAAYHLNQMFGTGLNVPWLTGLAQVGYAGVDLFFVISGYIMAKTTEHLPPTPRAATSFLLLPTLLPYHLLPIAWTLSFELLFYVCTALLVVWNRRRAGRFLFAWASVVVALNAVWLATGFYHPDNVSEVGITQWFFFYSLALEFIGGFLLHSYLSRGASAPWWPWLAAAALFCVAIAVYQRVGHFHMAGLAGLFHVSERTFLWGGFAVCLVAAAVRLEGAGVRPLAWTERLGDASYSIYLGHILLIQLFLRAVPASALATAPKEWMYVLVLAGVVLVLWIYHLWVERPIYMFAVKMLPSPASASRLNELVVR
jgi:peptidoglycan/LPS O-acetylase OafA/YrhL